MDTIVKSKNGYIQVNWKKFISGDNHSLTAVFETYYDVMLFTAYYYFKNEEKSKDVVSDVFLKLLSFSVDERSTYLSEVNEKLESFLKVLVKNKCLDTIKVEKNRRNILNGIFTLINRSKNTDPLIEKDLRFLLDTLPERQKQILELHLQGFDNNEISKQLNLSYNTVRNTLHTAKTKIRKLYKALM